MKNSALKKTVHRLVRIKISFKEKNGTSLVSISKFVKLVDM